MHQDKPVSLLQKRYENRHSEEVCSFLRPLFPLFFSLSFSQRQFAYQVVSHGHLAITISVQGWPAHLLGQQGLSITDRDAGSTGPDPPDCGRLDRAPANPYNFGPQDRPHAHAAWQSPTAQAQTI